MEEKNDIIHASSLDLSFLHFHPHPYPMGQTQLIEPVIYLPSSYLPHGTKKAQSRPKLISSQSSTKPRAVNYSPEYLPLRHSVQGSAIPFQACIEPPWVTTSEKMKNNARTQPGDCMVVFLLYPLLAFNGTVRLGQYDRVPCFEAVSAL